MRLYRRLYRCKKSENFHELAALIFGRARVRTVADSFFGKRAHGKLSMSKINLSAYAKASGLTYETARRRAHAGIYGPVTRAPGKRRQLQLDVAELKRRGLWSEKAQLPAFVIDHERLEAALLAMVEGLEPGSPERLDAALSALTFVTAITRPVDPDQISDASAFSVPAVDELLALEARLRKCLEMRDRLCAGWTPGDDDPDREALTKIAVGVSSIFWKAAYGIADTVQTN